MEDLHSWKVSLEEAIRIQEALRLHLILRPTFSRISTIGGADVGYSKAGYLLGAIAVFSFPQMEMIGLATAHGRISFPYVPGLLGFREGPILIKAFDKLEVCPDVMIYDGQGICHPRGFGLASHLGLWLDLPSVGCAKTFLTGEHSLPGSRRGSLCPIRIKGKEVGAVLRTRDHVNPLFVSPGHRIDLKTSIELILATCQRFRLPEPLRREHHATLRLSTKNA